MRNFDKGDFLLHFQGEFLSYKKALSSPTDIRIHCSFYRLPDNLLEAAKVTKVLHAVNEGEIEKWKDKDFNEINFDPEG